MTDEILKIKSNILIKNEQLLETQEQILNEIALTKEYAPFIRTIYGCKNKLVSLADISNYDLFMVIAFSTIKNRQYFSLLENDKELKTKINSWTFDEVKSSFQYVINSSEEDEEKVKSIMKELEIKIPLRYSESLIISIIFLPFLELKSRINFIKSFMKSNQMKNNLISENVKDLQIGELIDLLNNNLQKVIIENQNDMDLLKKQIDCHEEILEFIESEKIYELTEIPLTWYQYVSPTILIDLYTFINMQSLNAYRYIKTQNNIIEAKINKTPLTKYLYSKRIDPEKIDSDYLTSLENKENIINVLNFLELLCLSLKDILYNNKKFILSLTDEQIKFLTFLINNNVLDKNNLKDHLESIESIYDTIKTNYSILKDIINFNNEFYRDIIIYKHPSLLRKKLSVLKEYNLSQNNFIFLISNYQFLKYYDLIIEKSISPIYFISICKSPNPLLTIKKILICQLISEPYTLPSNMLSKKVTELEKFICADEDVDNFIENDTKKAFSLVNSSEITNSINLPFVKQLDEMYRSGNLYIFGEVCISRPKFLRNLEEKSVQNVDDINIILDCMLTNSILSQSEIIKVRKALNSNVLKK